MMVDKRETVAEALRELLTFTQCRCSEDWTKRGMHAVGSACEYREEVETVADAFGTLLRGPVIHSEDLEFSVFRSPMDAITEGDSGITLRHKPTDIVISMSKHRTQVQNKVAAYEELKRRLTSIQF